MKIKPNKKRPMCQKTKNITENVLAYQMPTIQEVLKGYLQFQRLSQEFVTESVIQNNRRQKAVAG